MNQLDGLTKDLSEDPAEVSLPEDLRQLADDAKVLAKAELAYQKARATYAGNEVKTLAILGVAAAVFAFFGLMALIMGTVIALGPALGLWGATAAVSGGLFLIVVLCGLAILVRVKRMKAVLSDQQDD